MIKEFVDIFMNKKTELEEILKTEHPTNYKKIVEIVVGILKGDDDESISDEYIHEIDDGDYQGALIYVIGAGGYQPDDYWYVKVWYGSCSGCDTLQAIRDYSDEIPTEKQVADYMTLCLHIVQRIKRMSDDEDSHV